MNFILLCVVLGSGQKLLLASQDQMSTAIGLDKPTQTNFNTTVSWPILVSGQASVVLPDAPAVGKPFVTCVFHVEADGWRYDLCTRTFAPNWSSPARYNLISKRGRIGNLGRW